jgi:maleylpyruvate isomerase
LAAIVGCDIHPINNKRILDFLRQNFNVDEAAIHLWCSTWITSGFDAYEAILRRTDQDGGFSVGDTPTLADCYLIPQIESARRFKVDVARWPLISAVETQCLGLPAFAKAVPALQPDAA